MQLVARWCSPSVTRKDDAELRILRARQGQGCLIACCDWRKQPGSRTLAIFHQARGTSSRFSKPLKQITCIVRRLCPPDFQAPSRFYYRQDVLLALCQGGWLERYRSVCVKCVVSVISSSPTLPIISRLRSWRRKSGDRPGHALPTAGRAIDRSLESSAVFAPCTTQE
jgi:hypothetical protein